MHRRRGLPSPRWRPPDCQCSPCCKRRIGCASPLHAWPFQHHRGLLFPPPQRAARGGSFRNRSRKCLQSKLSCASCASAPAFLPLFAKKACLCLLRFNAALYSGVKSVLSSAAISVSKCVVVANPPRKNLSNNMLLVVAKRKPILEIFTLNQCHKRCMMVVSKQLQ